MNNPTSVPPGPAARVARKNGAPNRTLSALLGVLCTALLVLAACSSTVTPEELSPPSGNTGESGETGAGNTGDPDPDPTEEEVEPTEVPATPVPSAEPQALAVCAATASDNARSIADNDLDELSGLAFSVANPGVLWAHNDSGDGPNVWAVDAESGKKIDVIEFSEIEAIDWEDMAVGPGPDGQSHLYIADFGDNLGERESVLIYRTIEPTVDDDRVKRNGPLEVIELTYPERIADSEALVVDPLTGDLLIITKRFNNAPAEIMYVPAPPAGSSTAVMEQVALTDFESFEVNPLATQVDGGLVVTAADISPAGDVVLVRTYAALFAFPRQIDQPVWTALLAQPCEADSAVEIQGEAVAINGDSYITISEGKEPAVYEWNYEQAPR